MQLIPYPVPLLWGQPTRFLTDIGSTHPYQDQSPGLASSQAIALEVESIYLDSLEKDNVEVIKNENFNPRRRPLIRLNKKTVEERQELIKQNPKVILTIMSNV